jgi:anti-anti-sigma factor
MFTYNIEKLETNVTIFLEGTLDIEVTEVVDNEIRPLLDSFTHVVIDFSKLEFIDSTGIGLLLDVVQALQSKNIEVRMKNLSEDIKEIFEILEIDAIVGEGVLV